MNKEAVLEVAEKTLDVVEPAVDAVGETVEAVERIPNLRLNGTTRKQQIIILTFTAAASALVSGVVVGKIVQKRMTLKYEAIITQELAEAKAFYQQLSKPSLNEMANRLKPKETGKLLLEDAPDVIINYQGKMSKEQERSSIPDTVTHNIFVEGKPMDPDFDYEAEIANRSEDRPYVISYDEFQQGEKEYEQTSLSWYEGDDTLTDDKDQPIDNIDSVVGEENLQRFGYGSKDPRVVYVRNDVMELDFEIAKHTASYAQAVLGFQHSDRPGSRKRPRYRGDDG